VVEEVEAEGFIEHFKCVFPFVCERFLPQEPRDVGEVDVGDDHEVNACVSWVT